MRQFAMTINLRDDPEARAAYRHHHDHIWPEVRAALKAVGIRHLTIWLSGRRLFMLLETHDAFDPAVDFPRYLSLDPRCREWEDLMTTYQEPLPEARVGEKWVLMEELFSLE
jgi:L-rhamnose mutarotase